MMIPMSLKCSRLKNMKSLRKLSNWLKRQNLIEEAREVERIFRLASTKITYKVRGGDVLGRIAEDFGVSVKELQDANGLKDTKIKIGQVLNIPTTRLPATEDEIVAMTLLGEGGTLNNGEKIMAEVLTVLLNRQDCISGSLSDIATQRKQFSFWNNRDANITLHNDDAYGNTSKHWEKALSIAKARKRDADVGNSTHYWNPDIIKSPGWGHDMKEVYTHPGVHVYGVMNDGSKYDKCTSK
jgi:LysM repeat protein